MKTFIALLRGINVGGNNKIAMPELKKAFLASGFFNVVTYINSGNIIFDSNILSENEIKNVCEEAIMRNFKLEITVNIISADNFIDAVKNAPIWWNSNKNDKNNALFVIPPMTAEEVCREVGEFKPEYEKIAVYGSVIFWTAPLATFSRTRWAGIVGARVYKYITIRNANTTLKLMEIVATCFYKI